MAKKKKTQLKPVARGFATTSVPKKAVVAEPDDVDDPLADAAPDDAVEPSEGAAGKTAKSAADEFDPAQAEDQSLQNLVDKLQEKTEKEIGRAIKAIEFDKRMSKSLPLLEVEPALVNQVFELIQECPPLLPRPVTLTGEPDEKVLLKLGTTYGTLRRLGFSEERVQECLNAIPGVELDDAFDWLSLNCDESEMIFGQEETDREEARQFRMNQRAQHALSSSGTPALSSSVTSSPAPDLDRRHFISAPPSAGFQSPAESLPDSEDELSVIKSRILASYGRNPSEVEGTSNASADLGLDMDPHVEYAKIKLAMTHLAEARKKDPSLWRSGRSGDVMNELKEKLDKIKNHYFFREVDGEALFQREKERADFAVLDASLRGLTLAQPSNDVPLWSASDGSPQGGAKKFSQGGPATSTASAKAKTVSSPPEDNHDQDRDDASDEEGMFGTMLDEMPTEETTKTGTVVRIRDMALPKHGGGRAPKVLLSDTVQKQHRGKHAAIFYHRVGGASRACRSAITIRWEGGVTQEWLMEDVGCYDQTQADNYIATVALHGITYSKQPGFATHAVLPGAQTSFRLLPPGFRDLWDELEIKRKEEEDDGNRRVWALLRQMAETKMEGWSSRAVPKLVKDSGARTTDSTGSKWSSSADLSPQQLQAGFYARQQSHAYQEMLMYRNKLPIAPFREHIMETLDRSQILVLSGETGCGKSTQVPNFILEEHLSQGRFCKILVTEPRRISAISLAQRVSQELGDPPGTLGTLASLVGYSIRLESNTTRNTRLTFATNGIALRMLENGSDQNGKGAAFDDITHIVVDEVHERSIESDFLLIVIKSLLHERKDLKVVLMSATLDAEKISAYFGGCPTVSVPGRTFPVEVGFLEDAVEFSGWRVKEGSPYAKRRNDKYAKSGKQARFEWNEDDVVDDDDDQAPELNAPAKFEKRYSADTVSTLNLLDDRVIAYDLVLRILERLSFEDDTYMRYSAAILIFMPGLNEIRRMNDILTEHPMFGAEQAFRIYPLHSLISSEGQTAVFDVPPVGVRKIVIATNIAETGITIPDITCVIDTGRHREMRFDEKRQISRLVECYIAKSNAKQRRGRAGRVQAGLCFHLFTKLKFETQMAEHPLPEMMRLSLSDLALRIKILKVNLGSSIEDALSRALDPPSSINIQRAVAALVEVKALTSSEDITPMGRLLSKLPTDVHLGKFLLLAALFRCLDPALTIAAALNLKSPFLSPFGYEQEAERAKLSFKIENSDFLTLHNVFASWRRACNNPGSVRAYCRKNYLSYPNLLQIEELRQQFLSYLVDSSFIRVDKAYERELSRARYSRSGKARFVAVPPPYDQNASNHAIVHAALAAGLYPKLLSVDTGNGQLRTLGNSAPAAVHPSSVNFRTKALEYNANYLSYFTLMQSKKLYAWEIGPADDLALILLCGDVEHKLSSNSVFVDRRIKFRLSSARANVALVYLRERAAAVINGRMKGKDAAEEHEKWWDLLLDVLGKKEISLDKAAG